MPYDVGAVEFGEVLKFVDDLEVQLAKLIATSNLDPRQAREIIDEIRDIDVMKFASMFAEDFEYMGNQVEMFGVSDFEHLADSVNSLEVPQRIETLSGLQEGQIVTLGQVRDLYLDVEKSLDQLIKNGDITIGQAVDLTSKFGDTPISNVDDIVKTGIEVLQAIGETEVLANSTIVQEMQQSLLVTQETSQPATRFGEEGFIAPGQLRDGDRDVNLSESQVRAHVPSRDISAHDLRNDQTNDIANNQNDTVRNETVQSDVAKHDAIRNDVALNDVVESEWVALPRFGEEGFIAPGQMRRDQDVDVKPASMDIDSVAEQTMMPRTFDYEIPVDQPGLLPRSVEQQPIQQQPIQQAGVLRDAGQDVPVSITKGPAPTNQPSIAQDPSPSIVKNNPHQQGQVRAPQDKVQEVPSKQSLPQQNIVNQIDQKQTQTKPAQQPQARTEPAQEPQARTEPAQKQEPQAHTEPAQKQQPQARTEPAQKQPNPDRESELPGEQPVGIKKKSDAPAKNGVEKTDFSKPLSCCANPGLACGTCPMNQNKPMETGVSLAGSRSRSLTPISLVPDSGSF